MALSAADLATMRADAETLMPDTCTVLRASEVSDGQGGFTTSWVEHADYACNVAAGPYMRFDSERVAAGQPTAVGILFASLPHDADVEEADRIGWVKAGAASGVTLEVTSAGTRSWAVNKRVGCKAVGE